MKPSTSNVMVAIADAIASAKDEAIPLANVNVDRKIDHDDSYWTGYVAGCNAALAAIQDVLDRLESGEPLGDEEDG